MAQRSPLHELPNDYSISSPASPTLSSPIPPRPRKRQRVTDQENEDILLKAFDKPQSKLISAEEDVYAEVQEIVPRKQHASTFARLQAATLSTRRLPLHRPSPVTVLQSLVSSHHSDVFKIHSTSSHHTFDLPVSCTFSNHTKRGDGSYLLAVSTEEGKIEIMDTRRRAEMDMGRLSEGPLV